MKNNAKNVFWYIINTALVVFCVFLLYGISSIGQYVASLPITRTIVVTADAKSTVAPDISKIVFAVVSEGEDPAKLQSANTKKMGAALEFVQNQGIDSKDIKTTDYSLSPRYEYDEKKRRTFIAGYTSTQGVTLKVRDFAKVAMILAQLPGLGINQIQSVTFEVENPDKYLNDVRAEAFKKAAAKADAMARQNGARLGRVVTFGEQSALPFPRLYESKIAVLGVDSAAQIAPGSEELQMSVSVTYELR